MRTHDPHKLFEGDEGTLSVSVIVPLRLLQFPSINIILLICALLYDIYACPLCSKSFCDMSKVWEKFDMEIASTPMPEPYQNKLVSLIVCKVTWATESVSYIYK